MFIGHYAPAFVAAALPGRGTPRLGAMFVAAQLVDVAFFLFVLGGVEHMRLTPGHTVMNAGDFWYMPYTHSLIGTLGFAAAWAVVARLRRLPWRTAWIGAAVVASHWLLDLVVHAPDLTLLGVGRRYGFALWNDPQVAMPLELAVVALAVTFYASRTRAVGWRGHAALVVLIAALLGAQLVNWTTPQPAAIVDPAPVSAPLTALLAYAVLAALVIVVQATRRAGAGPAVSML